MGVESIVELIDNFNRKFRVSTMWKSYSEEIKYNNRNFVDQEILAFINEIINNDEVIKKGTSFYRARIVKPSTYKDLRVLVDDLGQMEIRGLPESQMKSPPRELASSGRANPKGISHLYLASNPETACSEIRPFIIDLISISEFTLVEDVRIVNFKDVFLDDYTDDQKIFIEKIMIEFMKPAKIQNDVEYAPTQYISSLIKSKGYDGIKYGTFNDNKPESYNLILFNDELVSSFTNSGEVEKSKLYRTVSRELSFQELNITKTNVISTNIDVGNLEQEEIIEIIKKINVHKREA